MKTTLVLSVLCAVMAVAASQSCGSVTCATDEICNTITNTCQCNTTFYTFTPGTLPSPTLTCTGAKFNIQVSKCWLETNGYNTSEIRLNSTNSECVAANQNVNGISEMTLQRPLTTSDCNTVPVMNATHVLYTNQLYIFGKTDPIRITNDVVMNISCSYPLNMNVALNVTLRPIIGSTVINGPTGNASYAALMIAYKESTYTTALSEDDTLTVEDIIYLSVRVPDLNVNTFKLKVVNIYASPTNSSDQKYYLLQNGCPSSQISSDQLTVDSNGVGIESRFPMKVFQITSSNTVYLYADLALCTTDCNSICTSRSKSDASQDIAGRVNIYLDASDISDYLENSSARGSSMPWTLSALIFSWILMKLM
ncbi:pancreatic secretory granule membrane major glycoprotein GP2-like [Lithobates pipiens]